MSGHYTNVVHFMILVFDIFVIINTPIDNDNDSGDDNNNGGNKGYNCFSDSILHKASKL